MVYQKLSPVTLIAALQNRVQAATGLKCYDHVPFNAESPFYFAELVRTQPSNTKTMFRDNYTVWVHCIAEKSDSSVPVYGMIQGLQEAMTQDIVLPEPFEFIMQTDDVIQVIKTDETVEKHAVLVYEFMVCYGFKCKL